MTRKRCFHGCIRLNVLPFSETEGLIPMIMFKVGSVGVIIDGFNRLEVVIKDNVVLSSDGSRAEVQYQWD